MRSFIIQKIIISSALILTIGFIACGGNGSSEKSYRITFNANGGFGEPNPIKLAYGKPMPNLSEEELPIHLELFFIGYYDAPTGGIMYYTNEMMPVKKYWDKQENTTLYAQWTIVQKVVIVFHSNDENNETVIQTVQINTSVNLMPNEFARGAGYTFLGWSLTPIGTVAFVNEANYTIDTANVNLYAVWTSAPMRIITLHKNDGSGERTTQNVPENTIASLALNTFERHGHRFLGWSDISNGNIIYLDGDEYIIGISNVSLFAVWFLLPVYTITFHSNGGDEVANQDISEGYKITEPHSSRVGYTFDGWYYADSGVEEIKWDFDADVVTKDVDLFAVWTANSYTITFDANDGTGGPESVEVIFDQPMTDLNVPAPTRERYAFKGYFYIPGEDDAETEPIMYYTDILTSARNWDRASDAILYAQWEFQYRIGDAGPAGGIIFYDKGFFSDGWRYLEASPDDLGHAEWGTENFFAMAGSTAIGTGRQNTERIVTALKEMGENDKAAQLCVYLNINEFGDWFLPSLDELNEMYMQRAVIGNLGTDWYWSSTESDLYDAWYQDFSSGYQSTSWKDSYGRWPLAVRAIRAF